MSLLVGAWAAMGADSCSTDTKSRPDRPGADSGAKHKAPRARVGDAITLGGYEHGLKMQVKVTRVIDPVAGGQFDSPGASHHYVGVQLALRNVGSKTYDDAPLNSSTLIVSGDEQADPTILTEGNCASDFAESAKIAPGSRQQGCIPFKVKDGKKPKMFQFSLESGFGNENGEWRLR